MEEEKVVDRNTGHFVFPTKKMWVIYLWKFICLSCGIALSYMLYDKCLFCTDCNNFVVVYFALISLVLYLNVGLPVDKLLKIGSLQ